MQERTEVRQTTRKKTVRQKKDGIKVYSKRAMLFASVWLVVTVVLKNIFNLNFPLQDILTVAVSIVMIWTPGYISIWIDKVTAAHITKKTEQKSEV